MGTSGEEVKMLQVNSHQWTFIAEKTHSQPHGEADLASNCQPLPLKIPVRIILSEK